MGQTKGRNGCSELMLYPKAWSIIFLSSKSKDKTTKLAILVVLSEILPSFHQHLLQMATGYKRTAISQVMCIVNRYNDNLDYLWGRGENAVLHVQGKHSTTELQTQQRTLL